MSESDHGLDQGQGEGHPAHPGIPGHLGLSYHVKRSLAIHELLVEKGIIDVDDLSRKELELEAASPANGAQLVARAWVDPEFKQRLLADPQAAVSEQGYTLPEIFDLAVVENTEVLHHLVVCTLCSCYPSWLLGSPPDWYKSLPYHSRAVSDPRGVMREFGLELGDGVEVRVVDSTADLRYMVLPKRPASTENLSEAELASLVTRDCLIGVAQPRYPGRAPAA